MESQNPVLISHWHDISGNSHCHEVEQGNQIRERDTVILGKGLHEFESHATSTEMLEGEGIIFPFGIQNSHCRRHHLVGHVVVADNKINTSTLGIGYFIDSLNSAIEDDNQFNTCLVSKVNSFLADTISLIIAVGDIVVNI